MSLYVTPILPDELYHFGIKGQKWGRRRFQNEDMTWTAAGKERYGSASDGSHKVSSEEKKKTAVKDDNSGSSGNKKETAKKALKVGLAIAGTALAAYGTYKAVDYAKRKSQALEIGRRMVEQKAKSVGKNVADMYDAEIKKQYQEGLSSDSSLSPSMRKHIEDVASRNYMERATRAGIHKEQAKEALKRNTLKSDMERLGIAANKSKKSNLSRAAQKANKQIEALYNKEEQDYVTRQLKEKYNA